MEWELFKVKKDWRHVLKRAFSCWILYAMFILTAGQMAVTMAWEHGLIGFASPWIYPLLVSGLTGACVVARILAQREFEE